jgi:hypothetical protein
MEGEFCDGRTHAICDPARSDRAAQTLNLHSAEDFGRCASLAVILSAYLRTHQVSTKPVALKFFNVLTLRGIAAEETQT